MTDQPVAWIIAGMVVRKDGGGVSLADIEAIWETMHGQLALLGLRVAGMRAVPLTQAEMEGGDLHEIMAARVAPGLQPL